MSIAHTPHVDFLVMVFAIAMGTVGRAYTFLVAFVAFLLGFYVAAMTQQPLFFPAFLIVGGLVAMRLRRWRGSVWSLRRTPGQLPSTVDDAADSTPAIFGVSDPDADPDTIAERLVGADGALAPHRDESQLSRPH